MKNAAQARREDRAGRPAPHRPRPACLAHAAVQGRHRRRAAQRADPHGDRRRPGRRGLHRATAPSNFEALKRERARATAPKRWRRSAASRPRRIREVARAFATAKGAMILWGMGISQHVHGTDNARCLIALVTRDRPDRQARHGPASAARPEQRAGRERRRADPDDVPQLPARRQPGRARAGSRTSGARRSTTSRATRWSRSCTRRWRRTAIRTRSAACTSWARTRR